MNPKKLQPNASDLDAYTRAMRNLPIHTDDLTPEEDEAMEEMAEMAELWHEINQPKMAASH